jgi:hypothetical protein
MAVSGCPRLQALVAVSCELKRDGLDMLPSALGESCKIQTPEVCESHDKTRYSDAV